MPKSETIDTDAVFAELDTVAGAFSRLQHTPVWKTDARRLSIALQDITAALAQAAFAEFPDDERRWRAGSMLFGVPDAFKDAATGNVSDTWSATTLAVEDAILGSPPAPEPAVVSAFRNAAMRVLKDLEASEADETAAALQSFDNLAARVAERPFGPKLASEAQPMLIATLERLDRRTELRTRLDGLAASEDDRVREFAEGRLRVLEARQSPLDLSFQNIAGAPMNLESFRGQVVLLQFWASWCGPCRAEIPHLRTAYDAYRDRGFQIIGLSLDKVAEGETYEGARIRVAAFMQENGMDWPTQFDGLWWNNACAKRFGVRGIPASLLLDRDGRVAALNPRGSEIALKVEQLLA